MRLEGGGEGMRLEEREGAGREPASSWITFGYPRSIGGSSDGKRDAKICLQASLTQVFASLLPPAGPVSLILQKLDNSLILDFTFRRYTGLVIENNSMALRYANGKKERLE